MAAETLSEAPKDAVQTNRLSDLASGLGAEIVDVAGFLDVLQATCEAQRAGLQDVTGTLNTLVCETDAVGASVDAIGKASQAGNDAVAHSAGTVRASAARSKDVATWVQSLDARIASVEGLLQDIRRDNAEITKIARHVNILAINASVEAARAGDAGRGFAVVAEAINSLSGETSSAANSIAKNIAGLSTTVTDLREEATGIATDAGQVMSDADDTENTLGAIANAVRDTAEQSQALSNRATAINAAMHSFTPPFKALTGSVESTATDVARATTRIHALIDRSEKIVQGVAALGSQTGDTPFIAYIRDAADKVGELFEQGIRNGKISKVALFDQNYRPIERSNPAQFLTQFTSFTDAVLPEIQEAALGFDRRVVFCAAVDKRGYLPTHNKKFSHPQGTDPVWNASNSRNRRMFDDRVGLKAGQSTAPFLLQVYRRDMGGGQFVMMKDLSAPIYVQGAHWGGLRMAYSM